MIGRRGRGARRARPRRPPAAGAEAARRRRPRSRRRRSTSSTGRARRASPQPGTTTLRFAVRTPDGKMLTQLPHRRGPAHRRAPDHRARRPLARSSTSTRPSPPSGRLALPVDLPRAGRYHVLVDVYPAGGAAPRNFQLTHELQVGTGDAKAPLPAYAPVVHAGGLTFRVAKLPGLRLAEPASMIVNVTDAAGKPVDVHAVLRRAGARDLLPRGLARLLPLAHLRQRPGLHRGLRLSCHDRPQHEARAHGAGRAAAGDGHVATVPPGLPRGQADHGPVYAESAMRRSEHVAGFLLGLVLVVLGGRAIAYAATPTPLAAQLGGPRLPVITFVALAAGRRDLARRALARCARRARAARARARRRARLPGSRLRASARTRRCSRGGSLLGFAALETWLHSRAGMHMHWWMCLEGPVHRNAIPILLALSLAAAALLGALRHALAWARRIVRVLRRLLQPRAARRPQALVARARSRPPRGCSRALCAPAGRPRSPSRSHATRGRTT